MLRLSTEELAQLAREIRHLIMTSVSRQGGHLASNLGIVELTIALHIVFDFARDRLVLDVGHQCYVHKILTGRTDQFDMLRKAEGISGFPNPQESEYDPFFVGHAGTAVASALGLALGAQYRQSDEKIVAVVGDASIVNGLSFEGLNNTNLLDRQMLIILNDNNMAIDKTQGAFAKYLTRVRVSRPYEHIQRRTELMVRRLPFFSDIIKETLDRFKGSLKTTLLGRQPLEQLGIPFFGPIDGHDLPRLIKILTAIRKINHPVILHVHTDKGRGFVPATEDPCTFHSPRPFKLNGDIASFGERLDKSFTTVFSRSLRDLLKADQRIIALTAAMPDGTGLVKLRDEFPDRIIDVGIAESAAVDIAAGLAATGFRPIVAIYSTFMQRAFDQVFQEVALQNLPVVFCMDRAGLVGGDGAVHHGFCDISTLRTLPNMILLAPADGEELTGALNFAIGCDQPCAIRYPRDIAQPVLDGQQAKPFELGKSAWLRQGSDAVILAYGCLAHQAVLASDKLSKADISVGVVSARFAKPMDEQLLRELLADGKDMPVITLEDHALAGGFGSAVLEFAQQQRLDTRNITRLGMPDRFVHQNSRNSQLKETGLDPDSIAEHIYKVLKPVSDKI